MSDARRVRALLTSPEPHRWLFTGDSVTHGASHTTGARDYVQLFEERLRFELGRRRDHVLRTAISGRTLDDLRHDLAWSVMQYRPHVVSFMFGLNDAARGPATAGFGESYRTVVEECHERGAAVVLHTPNRVVGTDDPTRVSHLGGYVDAIRAVAAQTGSILVDHHADWERAEAADAVEYWISHGCHPNATGHRVLARSLLVRLGLWDPHSPTGRLFVAAAEHLPDATRVDTRPGE